jgi:hypothetical protein
MRVAIMQLADRYQLIRTHLLSQLPVTIPMFPEPYSSLTRSEMKNRTSLIFCSEISLIADVQN